MTDFGSLILYISVFSGSSLLVAFYSVIKTKGRDIFLFLAVLPPVLLAAFRVNVGTDYYNYYLLIKSEMGHDFSYVISHFSNYEIGFRILVKLLCYSNNIKFVFGALAFIPIYLTAFVLKKYYSKAILALAYFFFLFYHFTFSLNIMRQYIAVVLVFWGIKYVFQNRFVKYILVVTVASSIHSSAIFAILIYFLWDHKNNKLISKNKLILAFFTLAVFSIEWQLFLNLAIRFIPFFEKYEYLLIGNNGMNRDILAKILILIIFAALHSYFSRIDQRFSLFIFMMGLAVLLSISGFYTTFFKRTALYYEFPSITLIGASTKCFARQNRSMVAGMVCAAAVAYFVILAYFLKQSSLIPYTWT